MLSMLLKMVESTAQLCAIKSTLGMTKRYLSYQMHRFLFVEWYYGILKRFLCLEASCVCRQARNSSKKTRKNMRMNHSGGIAKGLHTFM